MKSCKSTKEEELRCTTRSSAQPIHGKTSLQCVAVAACLCVLLPSVGSRVLFCQDKTQNSRPQEARWFVYGHSTPRESKPSAGSKRINRRACPPTMFRVPFISPSKSTMACCTPLSITVLPRSNTHVLVIFCLKALCFVKSRRESCLFTSTCACSRVISFFLKSCNLLLYAFSVDQKSFWYLKLTSGGLFDYKHMCL